jgi:hypothetical protein
VSKRYTIETSFPDMLYNTIAVVCYRKKIISRIVRECVDAASLPVKYILNTSQLNYETHL